MSYRSIELNLRIDCPVGCEYCPQDVLAGAYHNKKELQLDDLNTILHNATQFHNLEVFISGFSEPLAAESWFELTKMCCQHPFVKKVVLFTTGYHMTVNDMIALSKLKKFKVHFHLAKNSDVLSKLDDIAKWLPRAVLRGVGTSELQFNDVKKQLARYNLTFAFQRVISRAGNLIKIVPTTSPVTCEKMTVLRRPVIMSDGTALACTNDYGCVMKIGNLLTGTWESLDFNKIISLQSDPKSKLPCFKDCHFARKVIKLI